MDRGGTAPATSLAPTDDRWATPESGDAGGDAGGDCWRRPWPWGEPPRHRRRAGLTPSAAAGDVGDVGPPRAAASGEDGRAEPSRDPRRIVAATSVRGREKQGQGRRGGGWGGERRMGRSRHAGGRPSRQKQRTAAGHPSRKRVAPPPAGGQGARSCRGRDSGRAAPTSGALQGDNRHVGARPLHVPPETTPARMPTTTPATSRPRGHAGELPPCREG